MTIEKPFAVVPHPLGIIATGNERAGNPASHLGEFSDIGMVWRSNGNGNLWARGDFGAALSVDHMAIIATNAQAGTTIRLRLGDTQAEVDGTADYDSGALTLIDNSASDGGSGFTSFLDFPLIAKRWWRVDIGGHTGDFEASSLCLGFKRPFANYYNNRGFKFGHQDMAEIDWGRYGVIEEAGGIKYRRLTMEFGWLSDTDRIQHFDPLVRQLGSRGVALWRFDPEANAQRQSKTYWGWLTKPPFFTANSFKQDRFEAEFDILSMI